MTLKLVCSQLSQSFLTHEWQNYVTEFGKTRYVTIFVDSAMYTYTNTTTILLTPLQV